MNENEDKTYQNWWDAAKAELREKFMVVNVHIKMKNISNNKLNFHFKTLEKEEQTKPKASRKY